MLRLLLHGLWLSALAWTGEAGARTLDARIARVRTAVATLEGVHVQLEWPAQATTGTLRLRAARLDAPELGYRFRGLDWRCPLQRDGRGGWRCNGKLHGARGQPLQLSIALDVTTTDVVLARGASRVTVRRDAASPDLTRIDLARVPVAWAQALVAKAWKDVRLTRGSIDSQLLVTTHAAQPLQVAGPLRVRDAALDTPDGAIAAESLAADLNLDLRFGDTDRIDVDGALRGGELLFRNAYIALQQRTVPLRIEATQQEGQGWQLPRFYWRDTGMLEAEGSAAFAPDLALQKLDLRLHSGNLTPLRDAYLSGWLGLMALGNLQLEGGADARVLIGDGELRDVDANVHSVNLHDPQGRFRFDHLDGNVRLSSGTSLGSELAWEGGALYGLEFGAARLPFVSSGGELRFAKPVSIPMLGGQIAFDHLHLRPPAERHGLDVRFGMAVDRLDVAQLSKALSWPAFTGLLSGRIPEAHYANDRLAFDGGLTMQLFGGRVDVSQLAMERPFGVAPTLSADITLDNLNLESLTGVFGFGSITGKLDGRIGALRLVDWQPVAFDTELHTDRAAARQAGVRQRISQRAVQNISSVGDASFVTSLQSRLIGLFDDFGYARIGITCRLADEVCRMDGLGSAGQGFIIVEGAGVPRLTVVGFNRRVDWPTLLERLAAVGKGDIKPIVD